MNYSMQMDTFQHQNFTEEISEQEECDFITRLNEILGNNDDVTTNASTPGYTSAADQEQQCIEHLILVMESKIMRRFDDLETKLNSFSLKQMKRKRTGSNRCKALNRKGEICNGYVCKNKSKHLCYAHYVLMDKQKEKANYLYSRK